MSKTNKHTETPIAWAMFDQDDGSLFDVRVIEDNARSVSGMDVVPLFAEADRTRWIPVDERIPEEGKFVLVCDMETGGYLPDRGMHEDGEWHVANDPLFVVTHWMPLPSPPEAT